MSPVILTDPRRMTLLPYMNVQSNDDGGPRRRMRWP